MRYRVVETLDGDVRVFVGIFDESELLRPGLVEEVAMMARLALDALRSEDVDVREWPTKAGAS